MFFDWPEIAFCPPTPPADLWNKPNAYLLTGVILGLVAFAAIDFSRGFKGHFKMAMAICAGIGGFLGMLLKIAIESFC